MLLLRISDTLTTQQQLTLATVSGFIIGYFLGIFIDSRTISNAWKISYLFLIPLSLFGALFLFGNLAFGTGLAYGCLFGSFLSIGVSYFGNKRS